MSDNSAAHIVIDTGSALSKAGFAGESAPRVVFPTIVSRSQKECYIGNEAYSKREDIRFTLKNPIKRGIITNWEDMEKLWHHTFYNELQINPEEHNVFLLESAHNPRENREKTTQIMFETFNTRGMNLLNSASTALRASGRSTGIVIESGDGVTQVIPIRKGNVIPDAGLHQDWAGHDLTEYLMSVLSERHRFPTHVHQAMAQEIKEKQCYVALNFNTATTFPPTHGKSYKLVDGKTITLGRELFWCPEMLFQPSIFGQTDKLGLHELLYNSLQKCNVNIRKTLCSHILLSGGNTMFKGLSHRLQMELGAMMPSRTKIKIISPHERKQYAWIGASIIAAMPPFQPAWITKEEYNEVGPSVVHMKCV